MTADVPNHTHSDLETGPSFAAVSKEQLDAIVRTLRRSGLCKGLSAVELRFVADAVRSVIFKSGQVICQQDDRGDRMFIIVNGRVKISIDRGDRSYQLLEYLGKGDHFGEMAVLTDGPRTATVRAVMDTELLEIEKQPFHKLMISVPRFAANLSESLGFRLRRQNLNIPKRRRPAVIGLVSSSPRTQDLVRVLAKTLSERGDSIEVLTDRAERWTAEGNYLIERIPGELSAEDKIAAVRERLGQVLEHHDRVLIDLTHQSMEQGLPALLSQCEETWWLSEPRHGATACRNLSQMLTVAPELAPRVHFVWILRESERVVPSLPDGMGIASPVFKVVLAARVDRPTRHQRHGLQQLVRHLDGTRVGVALGGGGARGLAHLGVLRALEKEGIFFDLVAGTSIGALMGLSYAVGWEPDEALGHFKKDLTAPAWVRRTPGAGHASMWLMYRLGRWERRLRKFFHDWRLEQLRVPLCTVAVDLVSGREVVRDTGDAVHAVLESINLPMISRPILRDGMALVDGGVLNNLPVDKLPQRGADLVVGIDVVATLPQKFAGNLPTTPTKKMKRPGPIETILRVNEVQDYGITALRTGAVDLMITPDTSEFDFADFSRAFELADAGEAAAMEVVPQLKQMIADLERS